MIDRQHEKHSMLGSFRLPLIPLSLSVTIRRRSEREEAALSSSPRPAFTELPGVLVATKKCTKVQASLFGKAFLSHSPLIWPQKESPFSLSLSLSLIHVKVTAIKQNGCLYYLTSHQTFSRGSVKAEAHHSRDVCLLIALRETSF